MVIDAFFHPDQLSFRPRYEWAFGERVDHPETTRRADTIMKALRDAGAYRLVEPTPIDDETLDRTHSPVLRTLYETARAVPEGDDLYPHVFPRQHDGDPHNLMHAGAFCFDAGTPLNAHLPDAARWSAASARSAALSVAEGAKMAYALSRPPGHHAEESTFGGYCYYNNAAVAVDALRTRGQSKVCVLDIDFHHGNGTQSRFLHDPNVLVVSIHGDPMKYYPFYCGFEHEVGKDDGRGTNLNVPLPGGTDIKDYEPALQRALERIASFEPSTIVVSAGLDGYHLDPVGDFKLQTDDFTTIGQHIASLGLPMVFVQEGGYYAEDLGRNVLALLNGARG